MASVLRVASDFFKSVDPDGNKARAAVASL